VRGDVRALPPASTSAVYRIVQEALTNAARHGAGSAAWMCVRAGALELTVAQPVGRAARRAATATASRDARARVPARRPLEAGLRDGRFRVHARLPLGALVTPVRVLIVDDDDLMRAGLRGVLARDDGIEVVGEARRRSRRPYHARTPAPTWC
jgi:hypothetical protein